MSEQKKLGAGKENNFQSNAILGCVIGVGCFLVLRSVFQHLCQLWESHRLLCYLSITLLGLAAIGMIVAALWNKAVDRKYDQEIIAPEKGATYLGKEEDGKAVYLKQKFRTMHAQVIGTTSAGKTESVILPWAINDIENGNGLLIIDGKSDSSFLDKLYGYVCKAGREKDFRLFSFPHLAQSHTFNPLVGGGPAEVVERVFSSITIENEYYRSYQYKIFLLLIRLIFHRKLTPTFFLVQRLLTDFELLSVWTQDCTDPYLKIELQGFLKQPTKERSEKISGLETYLSHFAQGEFSVLFNSVKPDIRFDEVLGNNNICYFQLPSMYLPFLAQTTGKLVLQSFQNAVSKRHLSRDKDGKFFSCFLDDFQDYIYEGFGALLNKSRSANIGVVFSHQSLGDLDKVSPAFTNVVLSNTNIKCVMRTNDPDTSEYFAKSFGTVKAEKVTERRQETTFGASKTGEGSVREVDQYIVHPNSIRGQATGSGFVTIPHLKGVKVMKIAFQRREDVLPYTLPIVPKEIPSLPTAIDEDGEKPKEVAKNGYVPASHGI